VFYSGAGPDNRAITIVMYLFNVGFELGDLGYASAIGWALVLLVAALGMLGVKAISRVRN
jgi:ABC-type sugar transport system permease subunit